MTPVEEAPPVTWQGRDLTTMTREELLALARKLIIDRIKAGYPRGHLGGR